MVRSFFVYGLAALVGGIKREKQTFNATAASASATILLVAVSGLVLPAVFVGMGPTLQGKVGPLSTAIAVVLISYGAGLIFSLVTHRHLYDGARHSATEHAGIVVMSEILVHSVEAASERLGLSEIFIGVFVVAVVGNAAEHSTAVWMAAKNKMDLAIGIAVESSKQIALFVAPLLVLLSLFFRDEQMTLVFHPVEVLAVVFCTVILKFSCDDGESNWLEGVQLLCLYLVLGIVFYFL